MDMFSTPWWSALLAIVLIDLVLAGDPVLFNPYGVIPVSPARHPHVKKEAAERFSQWLTSPAGQEAIASFRALVALAGDHMRLPEALLAIANCQLEMKDSKAARKTLDDLIARYPGTEAAQAAKDRVSRLR